MEIRKENGTLKNTQYTIYNNFERLDKVTINKFIDVPTTVIGDCLNKNAAFPSNLKPLNEYKLLGSAYTVNITPGDNSLVYYAIDNAQPGDVIIVAGSSFTERALIGELMVTLAIERELNGIIIDGSIRDPQEISEQELPVYAIGTTSNGPIRNIKNGSGSINTPISIGNRVVYPGDVVVGDQSGIISFHPKETQAIYTNTQKMLMREQEVMKSIIKNKTIDLSWLYDGLEDANSNMYDYF